MKYIVMENHFSYAVLLGDDGRFVKAANLHYEVGQTVTDIVEMKDTPVKKTNYKLLSGLAAVAACFVLFISSFLNNQTYASVFMVINPEVRIDINRTNIVVGLEGINEDGQDLIDGYSYKKKSLEPVMDELVDLAIEKGYLSDGEKITLTLDADDENWIVHKGTELQTHINEYVTNKVSINIEISNPEVPPVTIPQEEKHILVEEPQTIIIPTAPETENNSSDYGDSEYDESDYADSNYEESNYNESSYETSTSVETESNYDNGSDYETDDTSNYESDDTSDYESDEDSNYESDNTSDYESDDTSDYESDDTSDYENDEDSNYE